MSDTERGTTEIGISGLFYFDLDQDVILHHIGVGFGYDFAYSAVYGR